MPPRRGSGRGRVAVANMAGKLDNGRLAKSDVSGMLLKKVGEEVVH